MFVLKSAPVLRIGRDSVIKEALVLSDTEDFVPGNAELSDGALRLVKPDVNSASFLVRFGKK